MLRGCLEAQRRTHGERTARQLHDGRPDRSGETNDVYVSLQRRGRREQLGRGRILTDRVQQLEGRLKMRKPLTTIGEIGLATQSQMVFGWPPL